MYKMKGIKVISFDGDDTLWDFEKVMRNSLQKALKELYKLDFQAASLLDIDKMIWIRNEVARKLKGKVINMEDVRFEAFRETLRQVGRPNDALASHLNKVYLKHRFEDIELFDDVLPALEVLREKYVMGLLSNGNSHPERCGLKDMFKFVVFSQDYGVEKPDPAIFQIVFKEARCSAKELLHIGDSIEDDVVGAINAKVNYLWLNRKGFKRPSIVRKDCMISSLTELLG